MTNEAVLSTIGYGRWLLERGQITQAEFDRGIESVKQQFADETAEELLVGVDLTGLAGPGCDG